MRDAKTGFSVRGTPRAHEAERDPGDGLLRSSGAPRSLGSAGDESEEGSRKGGRSGGGDTHFTSSVKGGRGSSEEARERASAESRRRASSEGRGRTREGDREGVGAEDQGRPHHQGRGGSGEESCGTLLWDGHQCRRAPFVAAPTSQCTFTRIIQFGLQQQ